MPTSPGSGAGAAASTSASATSPTATRCSPCRARTPARSSPRTLGDRAAAADACRARRAIGGRPALVCGTGYTGEDGVELLIDPEIAPAIWAELLDAGVVPCGLGARDTLRLEACFHLHGNDLSPERNPIEAGLGWCCKEATGFVGADAVAEGARRGHGRAAGAVQDRGCRDPAPGQPGAAGGEPAGVVTSGSFSPSLELGDRHGLRAQPTSPSPGPRSRSTCAASTAPPV